MDLEQITDPALIAYFERRVAETADLFGVELPPERQTILFERVNHPPERLFRGGDPPLSLVYISAQHHFSCARYELAHEAVHEALAQDQTMFDWVQEMFAEYVALLSIRELGQELGLAGTIEYAETQAQKHWDRAVHLPLPELVATDLSIKYPNHTYARAYVTACELADRIGWDHLRVLGSMMNEGKHDVAGWLKHLSPVERKAAQDVLGINPSVPSTPLPPLA